MNIIKFGLLIIYSIICWSCINSSNNTAKSRSIELSELEKKQLIEKIDAMGDLDQKYRNIILLGTLNPEQIEESKKLSETGTIEEYVAFIQTIEKTLNDKQIDSLWRLQAKNDLENFNDYKKLIREYGYPSEERLNIDEDKLFPILLHPPTKMEPQKFLDEMEKLLLPEVMAERMKSESFASFVDNIKSKVLNEAQLYGTNKSFNPVTMSVGLPEIESIEETNKARKSVGLEPLKEGEYQLKQN